MKNKPCVDLINKEKIIFYLILKVLNVIDLNTYCYFYNMRYLNFKT